MKVKVGVSVIVSYRELNLFNFIVLTQSQISCWIFGPYKFKSVFKIHD